MPPETQPPLIEDRTPSSPVEPLPYGSAAATAAREAPEARAPRKPIMGRVRGAWGDFVRFLKTSTRQPLTLVSDEPVSRRTLGVTAIVIVLAYAALWSPNWYPLSDSSLYLRMAKGLAAGRPIEFIRQVHRSIRPLTPLFLSWVIRAGGGIGAMHVVMITMMLVSLGLMFLTVRNWFNERVAFWATVLTAASWWTYSNATTIMTEPAFLVFFWASLLAFSFMPLTKCPGRQWAAFAVGLLFLWGAFGHRVAAIFFVPGVCVAVLMSTREVASVRLRWTWAIVAGLAFTGLFLQYMLTPVPKPPPGMVAEGGGGILRDIGDTELERGYNPLAMLKKYPMVQLPITGGRWVLELISAGLYFPHKAPGVILPLGAAVMAATGFVLLLSGWVYLTRKGYWWAVGLATYYFPLWFMWGTRVKPRYMVPIAPILIVIFWTGLALAIGWLRAWWRRRRERGPSDAPAARLAWGGRWALYLLLLASIPMNAFAWGVEFYVRHVTAREFYDVARQGWNSDIIDICSWIKENTPADTVIYLNSSAHRRMILLLSDRAVKPPKKDIALDDPHDKDFRKLFARTEAQGGRFVVAFYEKPAWPRFHFPLVTPPPVDPPPLRWWQLWAYDDVTQGWAPIACKRDRTSMKDLLVYDKSGG